MGRGGGSEAVVSRADVVTGVVPGGLREGHAQAFDSVLTAGQVTLLKIKEKCHLVELIWTFLVLQLIIDCLHK